MKVLNSTVKSTVSAKSKHILYPLTKFSKLSRWKCPQKSVANSPVPKNWTLLYFYLLMKDLQYKNQHFIIGTYNTADNGKHISNITLKWNTLLYKGQGQYFGLQNAFLSLVQAKINCFQMPHPGLGCAKESNALLPPVLGSGWGVVWWETC